MLLHCGASLADNEVVLRGIEAGLSGGAVEVQLNFSGPAPRWKLSTHGNELRLDFDRVRIDLPPRPILGKEQAPISILRASNPGPGRARVAIVVEGKTDFAAARFGQDVILRLAPAGQVSNLSAPLFDLARRESRSTRHPQPDSTEPVSLTRTAPRSENLTTGSPSFQPSWAESRSAPDAVLRHAIVVLDPGHGGYDPGTQSDTGVVEKDVALQIALRLKSSLETRGVTVRMTRSTDVFILLRDRIGIANDARADLFVSIHLNSSPNREATGVEVYYLDNTTDRATIRLARMENGGAAAYGGAGSTNLNYIMADLRQQYKAQESASLARIINQEAVTGLDARMGLNVRGLGAKRGPFYVLIGAHMPAVLVECGFLSNSAEAARLGSAEYQSMLADGISSAIVEYLNADVAVGNL